MTILARAYRKDGFATPVPPAPVPVLPKQEEA
jgi:hypothetical protein